MKKLTILGHAVYVVMAALLLFGLVAAPAAAAVSSTIAEGKAGAFQTEPPKEPPKEELKLVTRFPIIKAKASSSFEFEVEISYTGTAAKVFDLAAKGPANFFVEVRPQYDTKEISAIRIDPAKSFGETVKIVATPLPWNLPAPGQYTITFSVGSGSLKSDIELKAEVTANYRLTAETATGRLNMEAAAGDESHLSITVKNTGTTVLKDISFSSSKPDGWTITFKPEKIDSLAVDGKREIDVVFKPSGKAIAGDYMSTLNVVDESGSARASLDMRVTVMTPTIWGWVGVGIVVVVIGGLVYLFMRLGRR